MRIAKVAQLSGDEDDNEDEEGGSDDDAEP